MSQQDIYDKLSTHRESRCPTDRSRGDKKQEALDLSTLNGMHRAAGAGYHPSNRQPVPEGNKERGSLADRAGSMRILAERPRRGGKVDHLPDVSRDVVRRREAWCEFPLLAKLRGQEEPSHRVPSARLSAHPSAPVFPKGADSSLEDEPRF